MLVRSVSASSPATAIHGSAQRDDGGIAQLGKHDRPGDYGVLGSWCRFLHGLFAPIGAALLYSKLTSWRINHVCMCSAIQSCHHALKDASLCVCPDSRRSCGTLKKVRCLHGHHGEGPHIAHIFTVLCGRPEPPNTGRSACHGLSPMRDEYFDCPTQWDRVRLSDTVHCSVC